MSARVEGGAVTWWQSDPNRLARDKTEVGSRFNMLRWVDDGAGGWDGILPIWPFEREAPPNLTCLVPTGLHIGLRYPQAYPMVAPSIRPIDPEPTVDKWTIHDWHVNGDGTLCLLQTHALWDPAASIVDLLLKAAGWRIEYALRQVQVLDSMTVNGIVSDPSLDQLITDTASRLRAPG